MLAGVPDEFHTWVAATVRDLDARAAQIEHEAYATAGQIAAVTDRRAAFDQVRENSAQKPIMDLWSGRPDDGAITRTAWRLVQPAGNLKPSTRDEGVA